MGAASERPLKNGCKMGATLKCIKKKSPVNL
jgi:hypothetical protein